MVVTGLGSPPAADTDSNPRVTSLVPNTIVSVSDQLAPRAPPEYRQIRIGAPPVDGTLKICSRLKKPTHFPSGEKNGFWAPSVPASVSGSSSETLLIIRIVSAPAPAR